MYNKHSACIAVCIQPVKYGKVEPCLSVTIATIRLWSVVCGLVFELGANVVRDLDGRELRSLVAVALKETGYWGVYKFL